MKNKVLITSCSRKVSLIKSFRDAGWFVYGYDADQDATALDFCNKSFSYPRYNIDGDDVILLTALQEKIDLLVPTRDAELIEFSKWNGQFDFKILAPDPKTIETCVDKVKFYKFCKSHGFKTPEVYFVKPRVSQSGKKTEVVWQEMVEGQEYSVDLFSHQSKVISAVPRKRLKTLHGESTHTITAKQDSILWESVRLAEDLQLSGHAVLQCFLVGNKAYWTDVNCRFGGASVVGIKSGCQSPKWLLDIINGRDVRPCIGDYEIGVTGKSYTEWEIYEN